MQELLEAGGAIKIIRKYGKQKFQQLMESLSPESFLALHNDWKFWCNPYQVLPDDPELAGYLMLSGRGTGKALRNDTLIITNNGWKTMDTIQVGEKVFDEKGNLCNVTAKYRQTRESVRDTYKLRFRLKTNNANEAFNKEVEVHTCGNHLWGVTVDRTMIRKTPDWVDFNKATKKYHVIPTMTIPTLLEFGHTLRIPHAYPLNFNNHLSWTSNSPAENLDPYSPFFDEKYMFCDNTRRISAIKKMLMTYYKGNPRSDRNRYNLFFNPIGDQDPIDILKELVTFSGEVLEQVDFEKKPYWMVSRIHNNISIRGKFLQKKQSPYFWEILSCEPEEYSDIGYSCITVDSPNHLFLCTKDLIPTHNTWTGSHWVTERAEQEKGPIAIVGQHRADVFNVLVDRGNSSIMKISKPDFMPKLYKEDRILEWPNGTIAYLFYGDETDQSRGFSGQTVWADELAKYKNPEEFWHNINMGNREGLDPKFLITTTPRPLKILKEMWHNDSIHKIKASTYENRHNLNPRWLADLLKEYDGTDLGRQEIYGEILWEADNAIFKRKDLDKHRVTLAPDYFDRIAISVDPAMTNHKRSDEYGIVVGGVVGTGDDKHSYLLEDHSGKYSVQGWVDKVISLKRKYPNAVIVVETNQGGDFVIHPLLQAGVSRFEIKEVKASKGKLVRAEPIGLICQQGRLHMVGLFKELEDELVSYDGDPATSPNRFDAYVWLNSYFFDLNGAGKSWTKKFFEVG